MGSKGTKTQLEVRRRVAVAMPWRNMLRRGAMPNPLLGAVNRNAVWNNANTDVAILFQTHGHKSNHDP